MQRVSSLLVLLAHAPIGARGFAPTAVVYKDPGNSLAEVQASSGALNRVWDLPESSVSASGLGSGITYAWDPKLCENLLPKFSEDIKGFNFIGCKSLKAAWARALNTWSVHHSQISFTDISAACEAAEDWTGGPVNSEGCSMAQLWVTTKSNSTGEDVAATAKSAYAWSTTFRHTTGQTSEAGLYKTVGTVIGFSIQGDMCWYLDSLFCSRFHELKERFGSDAVFVTGQVILWGLWTVAVLSTIWTAWSIFERHFKVAKSNKLETIEAQHDSRLRVPSTPSEGSAPSASLDRFEGAGRPYAPRSAA